MNKPVIILGSGGHAKVLINTLLILGREILGISTISNEANVFGINVIGDDDAVLSFSTDEIELVNGIGSIGTNEIRKKLFMKFNRSGYTFAPIIHPSVVLPNNFEIAEGVQIMAGAVIQPDTQIGINTVINTRVAVDHDCLIGNHVHIAPGCTISGHVVIEDDVHLGTGTIIIQNTKVHRGTIIGAGSLVVRDIAANKLAFGVPCKEVKQL